MIFMKRTQYVNSQLAENLNYLSSDLTSSVYKETSRAASIDIIYNISHNHNNHNYYYCYYY